MNNPVPEAARLTRAEIQAQVGGRPPYQPTKWDIAIADAATNKCWPIAVAVTEAKHAAEIEEYIQWVAGLEADQMLRSAERGRVAELVAVVQEARRRGCFTTHYMGEAIDEALSALEESHES